VLRSARPGARGAAPPPGTAVVIATSRLDGEPKLVALSAARCGPRRWPPSGASAAPRAGCWRCRPSNVAGVQVIVRALLAGAPPQVQDLRPGFRPDDFVTAAAGWPRHRGCTSLVPTQLGRLLDAVVGAGRAARFTAVLVGGAALDPRLHRRPSTPGWRVVTTYGMSETAAAASTTAFPLDGVEVDLDPDGRIRLGGHPRRRLPGSPGGDPAAFGGGGSAPATWAVGDRAAAGARPADDVIVTGGEKVAHGPVERVLAERPGCVRAACVVGLARRAVGAGRLAAGRQLEPTLVPRRGGWRAAVRAEWAGPRCRGRWRWSPKFRCARDRQARPGRRHRLLLR
jgi:O-succinylbenzoic acid--CoA ligase